MNVDNEWHVLWEKPVGTSINMMGPSTACRQQRHRCQVPKLVQYPDSNSPRQQRHVNYEEIENEWLKRLLVHIYVRTVHKPLVTLQAIECPGSNADPDVDQVMGSKDLILVPLTKADRTAMYAKVQTIHHEIYYYQVSHD